MFKLYFSYFFYQSIIFEYRINYQFSTHIFWRVEQLKSTYQRKKKSRKVVYFLFSILLFVFVFSHFGPVYGKNKKLLKRPFPFPLTFGGNFRLQWLPYFKYTKSHKNPIFFSVFPTFLTHLCTYNSV